MTKTTQRAISNRAKNRRRLRTIRDYVIGWTLALIFLSIVRGSGTTENGTLQFDFWASLMITLSMAPILGLISGYAQVLTEERLYRRISIGKLLTIRFLYAVLFIVFVIAVAYGIYQLYFGTTISILHFAFDDGSFAIYFYFLMVDTVMTTYSQLKMMLGERNLGKLLRGQFYTPREEERIFMFLDLQSSTQLAEKLGHIKYSMLIQDCFNDLGVVDENEAEIYQYVGDEVILTWETKDGLREANCIRAYFRFMQYLEERRSYYEATYQCHPFFKAGVNAGIVTVTEVGRYKKEIAYHGDTINTAARIQSRCNDLNQGLLISKDLKEMLNSKAFEFEELGQIPLRGKRAEVAIYGVRERT